MTASIAAEPKNAPVFVQSRPQRILVVDMSGQAEHDRVVRKRGGRVDKMLERVDRHDCVDRRDQSRRAGEPLSDKRKAGVGRRGRADDHVEIKTLAVITEPSPAIVALFVDDDGRLTNADGAKAIERVFDQRPPADRSHRLADAIAVGAQPCPMAGGDNASA